MAKKRLKKITIVGSSRLTVLKRAHIRVETSFMVNPLFPNLYNSTGAWIGQ